MREILLVTLLVLNSIGLLAQNNDQPHKGWYHKLSDITSVEISPFQKSVVNGASTVVDYPVLGGLSAGIGVAYHRLIQSTTYDTVKANFNLLPVFAEVRYDFFPDKNSPFIAAAGGYSIMLTQSSSTEGYKYIEIYPPYAWTDKYFYDAYTSGGVYFSADCGYKFRLNKKIAITASVNYTLLQVHGNHKIGYYQHLPDENTGSRVITSYQQWDVMAYMHLFLIKAGIQIF